MLTIKNMYKMKQRMNTLDKGGERSQKLRRTRKRRKTSERERGRIEKKQRW